MKQILLTGGSGFLGQAVYQQLLEDNYISSDIYIPRSSKFNLINRYDCELLFQEYQPEIVIHLAASCGGIGINQKKPGKFFYDNIAMGLNVIECARINNVKKFIFVGSVCSYPKYCKIPFKESELWNGYPEETNAPYGIAKKALYVMLEAYNKEYSLNSTVLIPSNLYGPKDNFDPSSSHVIPAIIEKIYSAQKNNENSISVWGDGSASREFLYVEDAAKAIVKSIKIPTDPTPINIGNSYEITIKNLVNILKDLMKYKGEIVWQSEKPNGQPRRKIDVEKAFKILNWKSNTDIYTGLNKTLEWFYDTRA